MSQESRINEALKQLGEEFRLGMVSAEEFRARRRTLLGSWGERDVTTAPGSLARKSSTTQVNPGRKRTATTELVSENKRSKVLLLGGLAAVLVVGASAFVFIKRGPESAAVAPMAAPPAVKHSPELLSVMRAATAFLSRNRWEAEDTDAFLAQWRALSPADQQQARQEPSLKSLRHELEQNILAESQLAGQSTESGAAPAQTESLDRLSAFARELDGDGP